MGRWRDDLEPQGLRMDDGGLAPRPVVDEPIEEIDPIVSVFSKTGIEGQKPGSPDCPAKRLISIGERGSLRPLLQDGWGEVLRVEFDDVTGDGIWHSEAGPVAFDLFTLEQADQILDFVEKDPDAHLAVHCAAGISRSVAVAAFVRRAFGHVLDLRGGSQVESSGNRLVFSLMVSAFCRREPAAIEELAASGLPVLLDSPILRRVVRIVEPAPSVVSSVSTAPRVFQSTFWDRWMDYGTAHWEAGSWQRRLSDKLRLRLRFRIWPRLHPIWSPAEKIRWGLRDLGWGLRSLACGVLGMIEGCFTVAREAIEGVEKPKPSIVKPAPVAGHFPVGKGGV